MSNVEVAEVAGVYANAADPAWIELHEVTPGIAIGIRLSSTTLKAAQARRLAEQLNLFADRWEQRHQPGGG